jgi:hypothetical protein
MEPLVVGLFGQPAQGKSTCINQIIAKFSKLFPGVRRDKLTYSRSCHVEHWDGYCNQPIVILDDIGQSLEGKDIKEFQTLVSCSPYIPPMAALEEKGIPFTSEIIILTSNLMYGQKLNYQYTNSTGILDDASFWRRIHKPIYVESREMYTLRQPPIWVRNENLLMTPDSLRLGSEKRGHNFATYYQQKTVFDQPEGNKYRQGLWIPMENDFLSRLPLEFLERQRFHDNIRHTWIQHVVDHVETPDKIMSQEFYKSQISPFLPKSLGFDGLPEIDSQTCSLEFDAFPPDEILPVRVEPIIEPLKVRTITAGIGEVFCLKPLQRAMWHALGLEKQFCLTHGTNRLEPAISRIWNDSNPGDVWISGDYTAATDSFPIEATKALLEGILESIDHEPTKRWAMKEISPHLLVYPEKFGLEPILQRSGQLMGSLLSFPLLCLLNDCTARAIGLSSSQYLINGDDILMRTSKKNYPIWKEKVEEFGLSLSLGKNYVHPEFGTVNSQLIFEDTVLDSGKQKVLDRRVQVLGECLRDLEVMMKDTPPSEVQGLFKAINRSKLSRTVRSISVPQSHGGLSFSWGDRSSISERDERTEILVYLHDLFKKIKPKEGCLAIPYLSKDKFSSQIIEEMDSAFRYPVSSKEYHEDFIGVPQIDLVRKRLMQNSHLRNLFLNQKIEFLPSLSFLNVLQIPFSDALVKKKIQLEIDRLFFINFLDSNKEWGYEHYRTSFLEAVRGVPNLATSEATKFLAPIIDLQVQPDYLLKVSSSYKCESFDRSVFEAKLGKALNPKQFNLPEVPGSPDFSKEVEESFCSLMNSFLDISLTEDDRGEIGFPLEPW